MNTIYAYYFWLDIALSVIIFAVFYKFFRFRLSIVASNIRTIYPQIRNIFYKREVDIVEESYDDECHCDDCDCESDEDESEDESESEVK